MPLMQAFQVSDETLQFIEAHKKRLGVSTNSDVLRAVLEECRVPDASIASITDQIEALKVRVRTAYDQITDTHLRRAMRRDWPFLREPTDG